MKMAKRMLLVVMVLVTLVSFMGIAAEAASISMSKLNLGYMAPTDSKGTKTIETVKLYGDYDYINFYINSKKNDSYFFYEIYSDKDYTKAVGGDFVLCDKGDYTFTPKIKLKGTYKTKTYYMVTYAAKIYSDGSAKIDKSSMCEFTIKVDRSPAFNKKMVVLKETKNTTKGAYIKWGKLSGTSKYEIIRRSITGTKWTKVATVSGKKNSYTDTSVKNKNGNYIYSVRAVNKKGTKSRYLYSGLTCLFAKTPVMKSVSVIGNNTVQVKWGSTKSGAKYNVMRKEPGGSWATIATNYSGTTYNDKTAVNGRKYTYSVKAVISTNYGKATSSYYANDDKVVTYLNAPTLNSVTKSENGPNIKWSAVAGASTYKICRMPLDKSESWRLVGTVGSGTLTFTDKTASADGAYIYTVRADSAKNKGSYYSEGIDYVELDKPVVEVEATTENEIKISWNEIPYATDCEIYCRTVGGEWELLDVLSSWSMYYFYDLNKYGDYEFCVRAVRNNKVFSEYSDVVAYHQDAIVFSHSAAFTDRVEIGWSDYGYESYNIYRRLATEDQSADVLIASVIGNSFKDVTVENDVAYDYTVIGVVGDVEQRNRTFIIRSGISTTLEIPKIPEIRVVDNILYSGIYYDDIYAYNYKYGYWSGISTDYNKEYYEEFIRDGKMKIAFADRTPSNLRTPIDSTIIEKEWFDKKIDFTTKVKNNKLYITCSSLDDKIDYLYIGSEDLGIGGRYDLEGADTVTAVFELPKDKKLEYLDIRIEAHTIENDGSITKAKVKLT